MMEYKKKIAWSANNCHVKNWAHDSNTQLSQRALFQDNRVILCALL
jgi:hypothetical protein